MNKRKLESLGCWLYLSGVLFLLVAHCYAYPNFWPDLYRDFVGGLATTTRFFAYYLQRPLGFFLILGLLQFAVGTVLLRLADDDSVAAAPRPGGAGAANAPTTEDL